MESGAVHEHRRIAEGGPDRHRLGANSSVLLFTQFSHALDRRIDLFRRSLVFLGHLSYGGATRDGTSIGYLPEIMSYLLI
jgi:hypothetical protein